MREKVWLRAWLVGTLVLFVTGSGMAASLTPYAYVELTKQTMEHKAQNLTELITQISNFTGDTTTWVSTEAQLNSGFDAEYEALYTDYGVSAQEFVLFYSANEADVESYLDAYPDDRTRIADLEAQISSALDQFEQLKIDLLQLAPVLPEEIPPPGV